MWQNKILILALPNDGNGFSFSNPHLFSNLVLMTNHFLNIDLQKRKKKKEKRKNLEHWFKKKIKSWTLISLFAQTLCIQLPILLDILQRGRYTLTGSWTTDMYSFKGMSFSIVVQWWEINFKWTWVSYYHSNLVPCVHDVNM